VAARLKARSESIRNKPGIKSGKKVIDARGKVVIGYPAEEILKYAEDNKIDLIMLATHDRSGFSRFVFGSVTGNMLRRLQKTPMFLVRPSH
jgi:nucleotide-binding universal stress UspA family protein